MATVDPPQTTGILVAESLFKNGNLVVRNFESLTDHFLSTKEQFKEVRRALEVISGKFPPPWPREDWRKVVESWELAYKVCSGCSSIGTCLYVFILDIQRTVATVASICDQWA